MHFSPWCFQLQIQTLINYFYTYSVSYSTNQMTYFMEVTNFLLGFQFSFCRSLPPVCLEMQMKLQTAEHVCRCAGCAIQQINYFPNWQLGHEFYSQFSSVRASNQRTIPPQGSDTEYTQPVGVGEGETPTCVPVNMQNEPFPKCCSGSEQESSPEVCVISKRR